MYFMRFKWLATISLPYKLFLIICDVVKIRLSQFVREEIEIFSFIHLYIPFSSRFTKIKTVRRARNYEQLAISYSSLIKFGN